MQESLTAPLVGGGLTKRGRTIALLVVLLAFFMDVLDSTIVNVAIPSIQENLGASYSAIQWIIAGYALAFALFLITGGRLGDILGYKKVFMAGIVGFTAASAFCGFATTTEMLIGGRLVQGLMAAMMVPQILSTIQIMYTTFEERRSVSAFYGGLAGVATVTGPILGALLISGDLWGLGWRAIFLVNVPVGIGATILAAIYLPNAKSPHPLRLDLVGVVLILVAMLLLMYPLIEGRQLDWPAWVFASMVASLPAFVLFGWWQVRKDRRDGSPLVVPALFTKQSFVAGIATSGSLFAIVYGFFLVLTLFLQVGLGYSVLKAGLTGIPFSLGVAVSAGSSGPLLVPRFGRNIVSAGPLVMADGARGVHRDRQAFRRRSDTVGDDPVADRHWNRHGFRGRADLPVHPRRGADRGRRLRLRRRQRHGADRRRHRDRGDRHDLLRPDRQPRRAERRKRAAGSRRRTCRRSACRGRNSRSSLGASRPASSTARMPRIFPPCPKAASAARRR